MHSGIIIVSNRLPVSVKKVDGKLEFYPSVGGLATGLSSYVSDRRNKWIGWPGIASDELSEEEHVAITEELRKHNCYPVFLTKKQVDDFYNGYSNSILWPLLHGLPVNVNAQESERYWKAYRAVNKIFAEATLAHSTSAGTIWVHDYQLMLLPGMLHDPRPGGSSIGFFMHIPFPAPDIFSRLPKAKSLVQGLLGSTLVGFHTESYVNNFLESCRQLGIGIVRTNKVLLGDRVVRVTDFPMGIDYVKFAKATKQRAVKRELRTLKRRYKNLKVILTVDRLDPTKGLAERLEAYRDFLAANPRLHKKVVMVMLAVPSRSEIDEYKKLKKRVDKLVDDINAQFGTAKWQPVDYLYTSLPFEKLAALYQCADVAFITPIRDGMNLVAKEYLASKPNQRGVLILSETAGAAEELKEAIIVDPAKSETLASALLRALTMPRRELKRRARAMQRQIAVSTVHTWAHSFMRALSQPPATRSRAYALSGKRLRALVNAYRHAERRVLIVDYDGVLVPFAGKPGNAAPPTSLIKLLTKLAADKHNEIIIASGRSRDDLEQWFGDLPVSLAAEHGALFRRAGNRTWKHTSNLSRQWKRTIRPILEEYAAKTPGATVEEKEWSLVWHYRSAHPYYAHKNLVILRRLFRTLPKSSGLTAQNGNMILEVRPRDITKANILSCFTTPDPDFMLILGDDFTDEDMFAAAPPGAHTVKVGRGRTFATYRLHTVRAVHELLKKLAS